MSLTSLVLAAAVVAAWFLGFAVALRKASGGASPVLWPIEAGEAILVTMFAALWFGSLGHGGWAVLFAVVGLLVEGPARLRHRADRPLDGRAWIPALLGVLRYLGAGALLAWFL